MRRVPVNRLDRERMGSRAAEAGEKLVCAGNVLRDLGAEFFRAAEFFFFTKTLPEMDFDAAW